MLAAASPKERALRGLSCARRFKLWDAPGIQARRIATSLAMRRA
jgi:hypothetical protein